MEKPVLIEKNTGAIIVLAPYKPEDWGSGYAHTVHVWNESLATGMPMQVTDVYGNKHTINPNSIADIYHEEPSPQQEKPEDDYLNKLDQE